MNSENLNIDQIKLYIYTSFKFISPRQMDRLPDKGEKVIKYREFLFRLLINQVNENKTVSSNNKVRFSNAIYYDKPGLFTDEEANKKVGNELTDRKNQYLAKQKSLKHNRFKTNLFNFISYRQSHRRPLQRENKINCAFYTELCRCFNIKKKRKSNIFQDLPNSLQIALPKVLIN